MHKQSEIDHGQIVPKRRIVQDKVELLPTERSQNLLQKELPDQRDYDTLIGNEACQASLNAGHLRFAEAALTQGFGHALHDCTTRQDDAQHEESQRFLLMPMHSCQQLLELDTVQS